MTTLRDFLRRHSRVALDTSIFIYQLQAHPRYLEYTDRIFAWLAEPRHSAVTSIITMAELLVGPYRDSDETHVSHCYALLVTCPNLEWIAPGLSTADAAARIRARFRLRTPDAFQAACALESRATGLITNDAVFERLDFVETLVLDKLAPSAANKL